MATATDNLGGTPLSPAGVALQEAQMRITELEAALHTLSNPADYPDLRGFHAGVRSVYGQAVYEGHDEIADWMSGRWPAALQPTDQR